MKKDQLIKNENSLVSFLNKKIKKSKSVDKFWLENAKKMILEKYHLNITWKSLFLDVKNIQPKNQLEQSFLAVAISLLTN